MEYVDIETHVKNAEVVKEMVIGCLVQEGHINQETAEKFLAEWNVVVIKNSWYSRWWQKLTNKSNGDTEDRYRYKIVKF